MKRNPFNLILFFVFAALMVVGLPGWYNVLVHGHRNVGYGQIITWGLWVAFYIHLLAVCAGSYLFSSLYYVFGVERFKRPARAALWVSLVSILGGMLSIWFDMGHVERVWKIIFNPHFTSVLTITAWLYVIFFCLLVLQLFSTFEVLPKTSGKLPEPWASSACLSCFPFMGEKELYSV